MVKYPKSKRNLTFVIVAYLNLVAAVWSVLGNNKFLGILFVGIAFVFLLPPKSSYLPIRTRLQSLSFSGYGKLLGYVGLLMAMVYIYEGRRVLSLTFIGLAIITLITDNINTRKNRKD